MRISEGADVEGRAKAIAKTNGRGGHELVLSEALLRGLAAIEAELDRELRRKEEIDKLVREAAGTPAVHSDKPTIRRPDVRAVSMAVVA